MTGWHQKEWPVLGCFPQHTLQKGQYNDKTQYNGIQQLATVNIKGKKTMQVQ